MARTEATAKAETALTRRDLVAQWNEDLARECQAILSCAAYSQVLKGAEYMNIAAELRKHAAEELSHPLTVAKQMDDLGGMPAIHPKQVRTSEKAKEMLRFNLENETETIRNNRERVRQSDALGEYAMAEHIREILIEEQEHQIDLATALGIEVPGTKSDSGSNKISIRSSFVPRIHSHPQRPFHHPPPG